MCDQKKVKFTRNTFGISLSLACAIHCLAAPIIVAILPVAGHTAWHHPAVELSFIIVSAIVAGYILLRDRKLHRNNSPIIYATAALMLLLYAQWVHEHSIIISMIGALIMILAYIINWRSFHYHHK